ncbi:MAG: hypothetical protein ACXWVK_00890 [Rhodoplanes sp.]
MRSPSIPNAGIREKDVSKLALEFSAAHPFTRFLTSMMYLSNVNGLSKMYYKNSIFLNAINFKRIKGEDKPFIFHNAFNLATKQIELFANREPEHRANLKSDGMTLKIGENGVPLTEVLHPARKHKSPLEIAQELKLKLDDVKNAFEYGSQNRKYELIDASTLCACSALPYIEETVRFESGAEYCEGALVDTVNFKDLIEDHDKIDEIWVSKIVDFKQINAPKNVYDALGNLCMLFAATVGDDDIRLFKYHALLDQEEPWRGDRDRFRGPHQFRLEPQEFRRRRPRRPRGCGKGIAQAPVGILQRKGEGGSGPLASRIGDVRRRENASRAAVAPRCGR